MVTSVRPVHRRRAGAGRRPHPAAERVGLGDDAAAGLGARSASPAPSAGLRSCCCAGRRPPPSARSRSSGWPSRTWRAPMVGPGPALAAVRTRWCSARCCCSRATSSAGSIARPGEVQVGIMTAVDRRAGLHRPRPPPRTGGAVTAIAASCGAARRVAAASTAALDRRAASHRGRCRRPPSIVGVRCRRSCVGDFPIPVARGAARPSFGDGGDDAEFIVQTLRLPRALTGVLVGAAFGMSGAIFQRIARNPLASPTSSASTSGAAFGAVFVIVVLARLRRSPSRPARWSAAWPRHWPSTCSPTSAACRLPPGAGRHRHRPRCVGRRRRTC